jgi:hypothetical protein
VTTFYEGRRGLLHIQKHTEALQFLFSTCQGSSYVAAPPKTFYQASLNSLVFPRAATGCSFVYPTPLLGHLFCHVIREAHSESAGAQPCVTPSEGHRSDRSGLREFCGTWNMQILYLQIYLPRRCPLTDIRTVNEASAAREEMIESGTCRYLFSRTSTCLSRQKAAYSRNFPPGCRPYDG